MAKQSLMSLKLAPVQAEETDEDITTRQETYDELKLITSALMNELAKVFKIAFPDSLEDFDEETAVEFNHELVALLGYLKGTHTRSGQPIKAKQKERKPLKRPNLGKLGSSVKTGFSRIP